MKNVSLTQIKIKDERMNTFEKEINMKKIFEVKSESSHSSISTSPSIIEENEKPQNTITENKSERNKSPAIMIKKKVNNELVNNVIKKIPFLKNLDEKAILEIASSLSFFETEKNAIICKENTKPLYWIIIEEGKIEQCVKGQIIKEYKKGGSIFEKELFYGSMINYEIKAKTKCNLWILKKEYFDKIIYYLQIKDKNKKNEILESIGINEKTFRIGDYLIKENYSKGEIIYNEGDNINCLYILIEGNIKFIKEKKEILKNGFYIDFKDLLLGNIKRSQTLISNSETNLYSINIKALIRSLGVNIIRELIYSFISITFYNSKYFKTIKLKILKKGFYTFLFKHINKKEQLYKKSKNIDKIIILLNGCIVDTKNEIQNFGQFNIPLEEKIFLSNNLKSDCTLFIEKDSLILEANIDEFKKSIGGDFLKLKKKSSIMKIMKQIPFLNILEENIVEFIFNNLTVQKYKKNDIIIKEGDKADKFYIVKNGIVNVLVNSIKVRRLGEGREFGEKGLILCEHKRTSSVIAETDCECFILEERDFKSILVPKLLNYFDIKFSLEDDSIELKDLENVKEVGKGYYGIVNLVRNKKNSNLYGIKALELNQIKEENLEECVDFERNTLMKVNNPFIVRFVKSLKIETHIFFLMEYIKGKELFNIIRDIGILNKEQTQFFSASIFLAVNYLHKNKIVYRDIKPENIMVKENGYIKLIDFGSVKEIKNKTNTVYGTPHYMSPEMVKRKGYTFNVDIWSIGICMYEFMCNKCPFGDDLEDPLMIEKSIINEKLKFPLFIKDKDFIDLISKMLNKDITKRLYKFKEIKNHKYFKNFKWDELRNLTLQAPYTYKLKNDENYNNEVILENYLEYTKRFKYKQNSSKESNKNDDNFSNWFKNF